MDSFPGELEMPRLPDTVKPAPSTTPPCLCWAAGLPASFSSTSRQRWGLGWRWGRNNQASPRSGFRTRISYLPLFTELSLLQPERERLWNWSHWVTPSGRRKSECVRENDVPVSGMLRWNMYVFRYILYKIPSKSKHKSYTSTVDFRLEYFNVLVEYMLRNCIKPN